MPSSLTRVLSRACGSSPRLPVSVCGTGTLALGRGFSRQPGLGCFGTLSSLPITSRASRGTDLPVPLPTGLDALFQPRAQPILLRHPFPLTGSGGRGFSTPYPSPTPLGLGLGPGLPWADEPSPGTLRLSAGRILTCLLAYLCRHSHFLPVHVTSRLRFPPVRTLPYPYWKLVSPTSNMPKFRWRA